MRRSWKIGIGIASAATALAFSLPLGLSPARRTDARAQMAGPGVARFIAQDVDDSALPPSLALVSKPAPAGPVAADWPVTPVFRTGPGVYSAFIPITAGTSLYGTGEVYGDLLRNGKVTQDWNEDTPSYGERNHHLYQSHPWALAVRPDGSAFGVLADTTYRMEINLKDGIRFTTRGEPFPVYGWEGATPEAVLEKLAELTGHMNLPPRWALGYQQCRWSYYPDAQVREIAQGFRSRQIPCDVIWLDIHYMDGYRIFTFDPARFPDPKGLNDSLHGLNFHSVWMIDPGVKFEPGYFVYDQGKAGDHFVQTKSGGEFHGKVWPGACAFPDFTRPETRAWWGGLYRDFLATGIDGVWNDMNEPSVFNSLTRTMPLGNIHRGGGELPAGDHALYHNVYGMLMARSTREGIASARPELRPFVLTRSNFIGGQRYAATWTGDNVASWEHLRYSVAMVLNLGMSGQPFSGPDIGGFSGKGTPEMFARWMGVGAFFPFSRGHAAQGNIQKEPWAFGEAVEASCRTALERRYRLLPYYYTLFREASLTGAPVMRPMLFADPANPALRDEIDGFLIGPDLLVLAQLSEAGGYRHPLPRGTWRPLTLVGEDPAKDINQPELRLRAGAIIPAGRVVMHTGEKSLDPLTLIVSLDENGHARGQLYEDAGDGFGYAKGEYLLTTYAAEQKDGAVTVKVAGAEGTMPRPARKLAVELLTDRGVIRAEGTDGQPVVLSEKLKP